MLNSNTQFVGYPRVVRPTLDALGFYIRLGRNDHIEILNLLVAGKTACFGAVFDPILLDRHQEVRQKILGHELDAILDPKTQQSATLGGFNVRLGKLPWGVGRPHVPADFEETSGRRLIAALGNFVLHHGFTQVLAPTHLLRSARDEWFDRDLESTRRLRNYLDKENGANIPIIYSLCITYGMLRDSEQRRELIDGLRTVSANAIWLKVDGFGSDSSPTAVCAYIEAMIEFQKLGIPIVADHVGGLIGLSLLSFGAAGGLSHGVTLGERFNSSSWRKPSEDKRFAVHRRVYIPQLDLLLKPAEAVLLLKSSRSKAKFGCNDTNCCPRGIHDMLERPALHHLHQRMKEISGLSQIPNQIRPQRFLEKHLRPTTDCALAAANMKWDQESMANKMRTQRKRLDALRIALSFHANKMSTSSSVPLPKTRAARDLRHRAIGDTRQGINGYERDR